VWHCEGLEERGSNDKHGQNREGSEQFFAADQAASLAEPSTSAEGEPSPLQGNLRQVGQERRSICTERRADLRRVEEEERHYERVRDASRYSVAMRVD